jgi:hypothetical protein
VRLLLIDIGRVLKKCLPNVRIPMISVVAKAGKTLPMAVFCCQWSLLRSTEHNRNVSRIGESETIHWMNNATILDEYRFQ